jgi:hypothetical protein
MGLFRTVLYTERIPERGIGVSPISSWAWDSARLTRVVDVDWTDWFQYVSQSIGYSELKVLNNRYRYISRTTPQPDFEYPWLYCTAVPHVEGVGPRGKTLGESEDILFRPFGSGLEEDLEENEVGMPNVGDATNNIRNEIDFKELEPGAVIYDIARLTVQYEALSYSIKEDVEVTGLNGAPDEGLLKRYIVRTYHPAGQFVTIPLGQLHWVETGQPPVTYPQPKIVPFVELGYTWIQVPGIPLPNIKAALGTVNNAPFDINNPNIPGGYAIGTLLFSACDIRPIRQPQAPFLQNDTQLVYDIHYRFKYLPNTDLQSGNFDYGHNYFLRRIPPGNQINYELITDTGLSGGRRVYPFSDFTNLFRFPDLS